MQLTITIPKVTRSRSSLREVMLIFPSEAELEEIYGHITGAILPVTFRLDRGARITLDDD